MKVLIAAFAIGLTMALTMAGAYAQDAGNGFGGGHKRHQQNAAKSDPQKPKADEKAYQAALRSVPDKHVDPWQGAR
jgi:hypothetical protein